MFESFCKYLILCPVGSPLWLYNMGVILGWIVNFMFTLKWNETSTQIIAFPHNLMIVMELKSSKN